MKKKTIIRIINLTLIISLIFSVPVYAVGLKENYKNPLERPESEVRFSTQLAGNITEDIEILGVTVIPHTKSNNVAYEYSDPNSTNAEIGALLNIYIKNKTDESIYPQVKFNGKTACEYIDVYPQQISWASTPDTRANRKYDIQLSEEFASFTPLTAYIPAGCVDCYSVNVTDGNLLYDGLKFEIAAGGKRGEMSLYGDNQYVTVERIQWNSSVSDKCYPDTFEYCIRNDSAYETRLNYIKVYDGTAQYWLHYWSDFENAEKDIGLTVTADEIGFGKFTLDRTAQFREYLVEFNITNNSNTYSVIHKTRPMIYNFDISVGWAGGDIEKESYIKAISSMHFNTVIGACGSSYYLRNDAFRAQYPIKIFGYTESVAVSDKMTAENGVVNVYDIDDIHAALPFGEPQLNDGEGKQQPMRVYNKLQMYRNSPYATNITLTHEPAFYRFAGLSDFCHYDAYRVVAPFSDAWYNYIDYAWQNKYAVYWGAPLETQGDYMRSLSAMNNPNPVAAWTQGANTWDSFPRFTSELEYMCSPNPYELRVQAYENVANGAASLYWFNINGEDLLYYKESSKEMMHVNREFAVVGDYLAKQIPYWYERCGNIDLNVNVGSDYAVMFAIDLNYSVINDQYKYFGSGRAKEFSFKIPGYLSDYGCIVKVTKDGIEKCESTYKNGYVTLKDKVDMTAMYVLGDAELYETLKVKHAETVAKESFNIYSNEGYYDELQVDYGYSDENPFEPDNTTDNKLLFTFLAPIVKILERFVYVLAAVISVPLKLIKTII